MKIIFYMVLTVANSICYQITGQNSFNESYLGQKPPGKTPLIFAPNIISTQHFERGVVFSPDGNNLIFQKRGLGFSSVLVGMTRIEGIWSKPKMLGFSGIMDYRDVCPMYSTDGRSMFFGSKRPTSENETINEDFDIWMSNLNGDNWLPPIHLGDKINSNYQEEDFSIAKDGTIYFSSDRPGIGSYDIYKSNIENGQYQEPELIKGPINTENYEGYPCIAADQRYLIFLSNRPEQLGGGDLFISFVDDKGNWTNPVNLGNEINTPYHEAAPTLSPDGKYLFFTSFRPTTFDTRIRISYDRLDSILNNPGNGKGDIYWVNTSVINDMQKE